MKNLKKIKNIKNKDQINQWIIIKIILQRIIRLKKNYQIRAMPNNNEDRLWYSVFLKNIGLNTIKSKASFISLC